MSLLTMVQRATRRLGIPVPSSVVGNTDAQVVQLLEIANEEGEELNSRALWSGTTRSQTFTQAAAADQGLLNSAICTNGDFDSIISDSMWNRTTTLPIVGPINPRDWQTLQAFPVSGPYQQFKIEAGHLYFDPAGANATDTIAFHFKSKHWCEISGSTGYETWNADTNVGRLDEDLMRLGIIWRWKEVKGLDYAQDFDAYEKRVLDALARDKGATTLYLNGGTKNRVPGVIVPLGSWTP